MRNYRFQVNDEKIKESFRDVTPRKVPPEMSWNPTMLKYRNKDLHRFRSYFRGSSSNFAKKPAVREYVFDKYDSCCECEATENLQIDHIVSVVEGYPSIGHLINHVDNLRVLCGSCNSSVRGKGIEYLREVHA